MPRRPREPSAPRRRSPRRRLPRPGSPPPPARRARDRAPPYLAGRSGTVMAAVYDVRTGKEWTTGQARPQAEASIVKVNILETLLAQRPPGGLSDTDAVLARKMIEDSDNNAATTLWGTAGGTAGIRAFDSAAGMSRTTPSACVQCAGFPWPGWGLTTTTPHDQITLLRQLF